MKPFFPLVLSLLLFGGCHSVISDPPGDESVFFPRQNFLPNAYMEALLEGRLVMEDGCLRVDGTYAGVVPVWPMGFSLRSEGVRLVIVGNDRQPGVRLHVGGDVRMGGGYLSAENVQRWVDPAVYEQLVVQCPGEYFIVGEVGVSTR